MSDPFLAEIRMFGGNFAPRSWALCNGQTMPISQNTALFSLLGTYYGGDGRSTFGLPNLLGRAPMHTTQYGSSPLGNYPLGQSAGSASVTLSVAQMAAHNHTLQASIDTADKGTPSSTEVLARSSPSTAQAYIASSPTPPTTQMSPNAVGVAGNSQPHNNMQPYLSTTFIIALQGIYPQRP